jgi:hypothetical protein
MSLFLSILLILFKNQLGVVRPRVVPIQPSFNGLAEKCGPIAALTHKADYSQRPHLP